MVLQKAAFCPVGELLAVLFAQDAVGAAGMNVGPLEDELFHELSSLVYQFMVVWNGFCIRFGDKLASLLVCNCAFERWFGAWRSQVEVDPMAV